MHKPTQADDFDGREFVRTLPGQPGVYRMLDASQQIIYVGKAKHLKKRVSSYFRSAEQLSPKNRVMVAQIAAIDITVTHTEAEALLLENNLIKELRPRYNILLRDDKSYPYIYVSTDQSYPRLSLHRGSRRGKGRYFGPYPGAGAVRSTLNLLQKLFQIRTCEDAVFENRSRPCLQYQIDRCSAPCVDSIDTTRYRQDIEHVLLFLEGRSQAIIESLVARMEQASAELQFEQAARLRDQISKLQKVQQKQYVSSETGNADVICVVSQCGISCISVYQIRNGLSLGNKIFFPQHTEDSSDAEVLAAFLPQFYLHGPADRLPPPRIITNQPLEDTGLLTQVLEQQAEHRIQIQHRVRGERARWCEMCEQNARFGLAQRLQRDEDAARRIHALQEALDSGVELTRIECFDISHTMGEATVAACVVFGVAGAIKSDYRRFNINDITPGDDYAAMHQALSRRYGRILKEQKAMPELLLIDGGSGQVAQARGVLQELGIDSVTIVGVAKGITRKAGLETLLLSDGRSQITLKQDSLALHLIQQVRDEAHRFAITGHRQRRAKARRNSALEEIGGIGPKRRKQLLQHFGGLQGIISAGVEDLARVSGINRSLAEKIYHHFQDN